MFERDPQQQAREVTERDFRDAKEWYIGLYNGKQPPVKKTKTQNLVSTLSRESVEGPERGEANQVQPEVDIRREEAVEEVGKRLSRVDFLIGTQESCDQTLTSSQLTMLRFTTV